LHLIAGGHETSAEDGNEVRSRFTEPAFGYIEIQRPLQELYRGSRAARMHSVRDIATVRVSATTLPSVLRFHGTFLALSTVIYCFLAVGLGTVRVHVKSPVEDDPGTLGQRRSAQG
jgi:hypothetical protein